MLPVEPQERLLDRRVIGPAGGPCRWRSGCVGNRKGVLIKTCEISTDAVPRGGCRRSASCQSFIGSRGHCHSCLSKIMCGVICYESLGKADVPAPARRN
jgi:hypothetical protein